MFNKYLALTIVVFAMYLTSIHAMASSRTSTSPIELLLQDDGTLPQRLKLKGISDFHLTNCEPSEKVTHLTLKQSPISDKGLKKISDKFANLTYLWIESCEGISDSGLECLKSLQYLTHLALIKCKMITDDALLYIAQLKKLDSLKVEGTQITKIVRDLPVRYLIYIDDSGVDQGRIKLENLPPRSFS